MSRSQKQARRVPSGSEAPQGSGTPNPPADVTQKDGAANIAGDVNATTADDYRMPQ